MSLPETRARNHLPLPPPVSPIYGAAHVRQAPACPRLVPLGLGCRLIYEAKGIAFAERADNLKQLIKHHTLIDPGIPGNHAIDCWRDQKSVVFIENIRSPLESVARGGQGCLGFHGIAGA